jgi:hypothetical protein
MREICVYPLSVVMHCTAIWATNWVRLTRISPISLALLPTFQLGQYIPDSRPFRVAVCQIQSLFITSEGACHVSRLREGLAERVMRIR